MSEKIGFDALFSDLLVEYRKAQDAYEDAKDAARVASSHETLCLNALNGVQKKLNEAIDELMTAAPRDSEWKRNVAKFRKTA